MLQVHGARWNLKVLRELVEVAKPLSIIYQHSCSIGEVLDDWRLANVTPIYKKSHKEDLGNYWPEKVMEEIILRRMIHVQDNWGIRSRQYEFMKGR